MKESKKLLTIAIPAMVEQFLQMLMGFVDNYLVARLGLITVSGVAVANNIIAIYQALFIALGAATSSVLSRHLVQGKNDHQNQTIADATVMTLVISLLCGLVSIIGNIWLLRALGTARPVAQVGGLYLAIVGGGIVSLGLLTTFGAVVRTQGMPKLPMHVSLMTNLLNALLSAVALFVCHWGIVGVAISTVIARFIGVLILTRKLPIKELTTRFRWGVDNYLLKIVLPAAGERLMMRAGDVAIVAMVVTFGTEVVAGNAVGETLTQFNYLPAMAMAVATVIEVAAHVVNAPYKIDAIVKTSFWLAIIMMYSLSGAVLLLHAPLVDLFLTAPAAIEASKVVVTYSLIGVPATVGTLIMTGVWQGLGNARLPFYATTIGMWTIRIGFGYLLGIVWHQGLNGVWLATILDNLFRTVFLYLRYRIWQDKKP